MKITGSTNGKRIIGQRGSSILPRPPQRAQTRVPGHLPVLAVHRLEFANLFLVFGLPHRHSDLPGCLDVRDIVHDVQLQVELATGGRRCGASHRVPAVYPRPLAGKRGNRLAPVAAK